MDDVNQDPEAHLDGENQQENDAIKKFDMKACSFKNVPRLYRLGLKSAHQRIEEAVKEHQLLRKEVELLSSNLKKTQERQVSQMDQVRQNIADMTKHGRRRRHHHNGGAAGRERPMTPGSEHSVSHNPSPSVSPTPDKQAKFPQAQGRRTSQAPNIENPPSRSGTPLEGVTSRPVARRGSTSVYELLSRKATTPVEGDDDDIPLRDDLSSSSAESIVGLTEEDRRLLQRIEPMENRVSDVQTSMRKARVEVAKFREGQEKTDRELVELRARVSALENEAMSRHTQMKSTVQAMEVVREQDQQEKEEMRGTIRQQQEALQESSRQLQEMRDSMRSQQDSIKQLQDEQRRQGTKVHQDEIRDTIRLQQESSRQLQEIREAMRSQQEAMQRIQEERELWQAQAQAAQQDAAAAPSRPNSGSRKEARHLGASAPATAPSSQRPSRAPSSDGEEEEPHGAPVVAAEEGSQDHRPESPHAEQAGASEKAGASEESAGEGRAAARAGDNAKSDEPEVSRKNSRKGSKYQARLFGLDNRLNALEELVSSGLLAREAAMRDEQHTPPEEEGSHGDLQGSGGGSRPTSTTPEELRRLRAQAISAQASSRRTSAGTDSANPRYSGAFAGLALGTWPSGQASPGSQYDAAESRSLSSTAPPDIRRPLAGRRATGRVGSKTLSDLAAEDTASPARPRSRMEGAEVVEGKLLDANFQSVPVMHPRAVRPRVPSVTVGITGAAGDGGAPVFKMGGMMEAHSLESSFSTEGGRFKHRSASPPIGALPMTLIDGELFGLDRQSSRGSMSVSAGRGMQEDFPAFLEPMRIRLPTHELRETSSGQTTPALGQPSVPATVILGALLGDGPATAAGAEVPRPANKSRPSKLPAAPHVAAPAKEQPASRRVSTMDSAKSKQDNKQVLFCLTGEALSAKKPGSPVLNERRSASPPNDRGLPSRPPSRGSPKSAHQPPKRHNTGALTRAETPTAGEQGQGMDGLIVQMAPAQDRGASTPRGGERGPPRRARTPRAL